MSYQKPEFKAQYENYIGGEWVAPVDGDYFDDTSPIDGGLIARVPKSNSKDIDLAVEAAGKAADAWGKTSAAERSNIMFKIAHVENGWEFHFWASTIPQNHQKIQKCILLP